MNFKTTLNTCFVLCTTLLACGQKGEKNQAFPPGYNLGIFEKIILADDLLEVSGIAFAPGKFDTLYAQQDEDGALFKVSATSGKYKRVDFGNAGDYEDLAIMKDTLLLMQSDGSFYGFLLDSIQGDTVTPFKRYKKSLPKGEYEGLFADTTTKSYYALCKSCIADNNLPQTSVYQLQIQQNTVTIIGSYIINTEKIIAASGKKKTSFRPSALARHPITKEFYVISSANNMLVILNNNWQIKGMYPLDINNLMQPEGLAFDNKGNMYISSEGDRIEAGRILKFHYYNKRNK